MTPPIPFRRPDLADSLDPELTTLFSDAAERLEPSPHSLDRAQAKIAARLSDPDPSPGGLRRRLAYGAFGGGALWATVVGSAAAHKAVAVAVVGGLLLGGGVVAETTGVGDDVRETIGIERAFDAITGNHEHGSGEEPTATAEATSEAQADPSATPALLETPGASTTVEPAADGLPGQFRVTVNPSGFFNVRGGLEDYSVGANDSGGTIDLSIADGEATDTTIQLSLTDDAVVNVPGAPSGATGTAQLSEYVGRLVVVQGQCAEGVEFLNETDCHVDRVQVLGGPAGGPNDAIAPEGSSGNGQGNENANGQGLGNENANGQGNGNAGGQGNGNANGQGNGNANGQGSGNGPPGEPEASGDAADGGSSVVEDVSPGPPGHSNAGGNGQGGPPESPPGKPENPGKPQ